MTHHSIAMTAEPDVKSPAFDSSKHPCFSREAHHQYGRIHLPVAPRCNIQCNFCNRKYDCVNESRPGVTSSVLRPKQALAYLSDMLEARPEITVLGIAGPGDPFANPEETMETLRLARERFPQLILCLASNGLGIGPHIDELATMNVSHVTITLNAVDPRIGAKIYSWVRDGKAPLRGEPAAAVLLERQLDAIRRLKAAGITVKINTIIIPGINDQHIIEVARTVAEMGVDIMNCMALVPVKGAVFEDLPAPDTLMTSRVRLQAGQLLPQMTHCARCRADAVGLINEEMGAEQIDLLAHYARMPDEPQDLSARPYVAVASMEGALVNQHLGEAARMLIFEPCETTPSGFKFREIRKSPTPGGGSDRWQALAELLHDCRALLVAAAGPSPSMALRAGGVNVIEMEGLVEEGLRAVYAGKPVPKPLQRKFHGCGSGLTCRGSGTGCG